MDKRQADYAYITKDGIVEKVGSSSILQPKIQFNNGGVNWFDDSKLLKKNSDKKVLVKRENGYQRIVRI